MSTSCLPREPIKAPASRITPHHEGSIPVPVFLSSDLVPMQPYLGLDWRSLVECLSAIFWAPVQRIASCPKIGKIGHADAPMDPRSAGWVRGFDSRRQRRRCPPVPLPDQPVRSSAVSTDCLGIVTSRECPVHQSDPYFALAFTDTCSTEIHHRIPATRNIQRIMGTGPPWSWMATRCPEYGRRRSLSP